MKSMGEISLAVARLAVQGPLDQSKAFSCMDNAP